MSTAISDLEDQGLVDVTRNGNGESNIVELTRKGWQVREAVGGQQSKGGGEDRLDIDVHNVSVRFDLRGCQELEDGWRERFVQGKPMRHVYDPTNGSYVYFKDSWRFRITGEHVIVRLEDGLRGQDATNLKDRAMDQVFQARDFLDQQLPEPAHVGTEPTDFRIWINRQHLALVRDPFCELVDQFSDVDLEDVKIFDQDGTERLWLDNSEGEQHLEAGNAPGENREFAEDDIDFLRQELYGWLIDNKSEWETLQALASVIERERSGEKNDRPEREAPSGSREQTVADAFDISSTWLHRGGHLMGWASDIGRPVKLIDASDLPGPQG